MACLSSGERVPKLVSTISNNSKDFKQICLPTATRILC